MEKKPGRVDPSSKSAHVSFNEDLLNKHDAAHDASSSAHVSGPSVSHKVAFGLVQQFHRYRYTLQLDEFKLVSPSSSRFTIKNISSPNLSAYWTPAQATNAASSLSINVEIFCEKEGAFVGHFSLFQTEKKCVATFEVTATIMKKGKLFFVNIIHIQ
eukprot:Sdes_comp18717_c0_seq2m9043